MLRIFQQFGSRLSHSRVLPRYFSTETLKENEELDREKRVKIFELEIDVSMEV